MLFSLYIKWKHHFQHATTKSTCLLQSRIKKLVNFILVFSFPRRYHKILHNIGYSVLLSLLVFSCKHKNKIGHVVYVRYLLF